MEQDGTTARYIFPIVMLTVTYLLLVTSIFGVKNFRRHNVTAHCRSLTQVL